jgi:hypothetical protein
MKIFRGNLALTALLALAPFSAAARENLQFDVPPGWINVTERVEKGDTKGLPKFILQMAKNPSGSTIRKLLMVDSQTLKSKFTVFMTQDNIKILHFSPLTHDLLVNEKEKFEEYVRQKANSTLVEDGIVTVNGVEVFRSVVEMDFRNHINEPAQVVRQLEYHLPDGVGNTIVFFWVPKAQWEKYLPLFEGVISKALK